MSSQLDTHLMKLLYALSVLGTLLATLLSHIAVT